MAVNWDGDEVRLVLALRLDRDGLGRLDDLIDPLAAALLDPGNLNGLVACTTYDAIVDRLVACAKRSRRA